MGTDLEGRIVRLEILLKAYQAVNAKLDQRVQDLEQQSRTGSSGGGSTAGNVAGAGTIPPVVIAAGGNAVNQTVTVMIGGAATTVSTTATVYNRMDVATVATANKKIVVVPNGDGSYLAVAQSC